MDSQNSDFSRRKFLSTAAVSIAAAGMTGFSPSLAKADETAKEGGGEVIRRKLGKKGPEVPIVSMGVMNSNSPSVVQASYEAGIRHFDTAAYYQFGRNEQMVGNVISKLGARDKTVIGTKIFTPDQRADLDAEQARKKLMQLIDGSLSRLKTDYVDILYIHNISDIDTVKEPGILEGLADIKKAGKARLVGTSTHSNMAAVINETASHDVYDVILTAFNFTMADDGELLKAIKDAFTKGLGVVAMKTMAGGSRWPNPESRGNYSNETIINAALKWVLRNENIATSIPGYTNFDHMKQNWAIASNLEYTEDEKRFLKDNDAIASIDFCRQCKQCLASCPNGVNIPKLMRTHMYAAQYANFEHARLTIDEIPTKNSLAVCSDCSECIVKCANTVDIGRRIDELKMIYS